MAKECLLLNMTMMRMSLYVAVSHIWWFAHVILVAILPWKKLIYSKSIQVFTWVLIKQLSKPKISLKKEWLIFWMLHAKNTQKGQNTSNTLMLPSKMKLVKTPKSFSELQADLSTMPSKTELFWSIQSKVKVEHPLLFWPTWSTERKWNSRTVLHFWESMLTKLSQMSHFCNNWLTMTLIYSAKIDLENELKKYKKLKLIGDFD